ncbi:MAG: hypothetical protein IJ780_06985 [Neisseriaceae bacterium]|nr:hypothetical protein [Neisseriaceae bacterium]
MCVVAHQTLSKAVFFKHSIRNRFFKKSLLRQGDCHAVPCTARNDSNFLKNPLKVGKKGE